MHLTSNSFIGVAEEREIKLDEIDVVLVERRFLVTPCVSENDETNSTISTDYSLAKSEDYDTDRLKKDLNNFGVIPGPITKSTKRVYIKQLFKLQKHGKLYDANELEKVYSLYSCELSKALKNVNWVNDLSRYIALDNAVSKQFSNTENGKKWRGGCQKASFTYLLLDPRITNNMPALVASKNLDKIDIMKEAWPNFIHSIFYIGKGIRSRPYAHLYEAVQSWNAKEIRDKEKTNKEKIEKIRNIWESQHGVVCLNVFQHVIPAEAFTREAAMIDALTLKKLTNIKSGEYYGIAASWSCREKKNFGVYLLYKAMNIFLHEGERQIYPSDIR